MPEVRRTTIISELADNGLRTVLDVQSVRNTRYFDAGGFYGRTTPAGTPTQSPESGRDHDSLC
jgi:hypothetical protein